MDAPKFVDAFCCHSGRWPIAERRIPKNARQIPWSMFVRWNIKLNWRRNIFDENARKFDDEHRIYVFVIRRLIKFGILIKNCRQSDTVVWCDSRITQRLTKCVRWDQYFDILKWNFFFFIYSWIKKKEKFTKFQVFNLNLKFFWFGQKIFPEYLQTNFLLYLWTP